MSAKPIRIRVEVTKKARTDLTRNYHVTGIVSYYDTEFDNDSQFTQKENQEKLEKCKGIVDPLLKLWWDDPQIEGMTKLRVRRHNFTISRDDFLLFSWEEMERVLFPGLRSIYGLLGANVLFFANDPNVEEMDQCLIPYTLPKNPSSELELYEKMEPQVDQKFDPNVREDLIRHIGVSKQ